MFLICDRSKFYVSDELKLQNVRTILGMKERVKLCLSYIDMINSIIVVQKPVISGSQSEPRALEPQLFFFSFSFFNPSLHIGIYCLLLFNLFYYFRFKIAYCFVSQIFTTKIIN